MKHVREFKSFLNEGMSLNEEQIYKYPGDTVYVYRVNNGKWETKKSGATTWIDISKYPSTISKLNKKFPDALSSSGTSTSKKTFSAKDSTVNPYDYRSTRPVQRDTFEPYRAETASKMINIDEIKRKINQSKKAEPTFWDYIKDSIGRKLIPNIVQLFDSKKLSSSDFTDPQKKVILQVIKNSIKRDPKQINSGSTIYDDYGKDVANTFKNERGSPSMADVAWNTIKLDQYFAMATLLGKFSWKKLANGVYLIEDKYDFSDPKYKELTGVNRKDLEGLSLSDLQSKFGFNSYEAARVKGWVEHPDTIPSKSLDVRVEVDPKKYMV
jgi:hypothetical protein